MMSQVLVFEQNKIRRAFFGNPDELWFVLADVCETLELGNVTETAKRIDDDEKGFSTIETLGGPQQVLIVSEAGVYKIAHTSRKQVAKRFVRWVTHNVLPSIRRTGQYVVPGAEIPSRLSELLDQKLAPVHRKLDNIVGIHTKRLDPTAADQRLHRNIISHFYFGYCPCGECRIPILNEDGSYKVRGTEWDYHHQINRWNNRADATIPLAKSCHVRIEDMNSEARIRFGAMAFPRFIENIKMLRKRPPIRIAHKMEDVLFFMEAKQRDFEF